jgi:hypothetical protein
VSFAIDLLIPRGRFPLLDDEDDEELLLLLHLLSGKLSSTLSFAREGTRESFGIGVSVITGPLLAKEVVRFFSLLDNKGEKELPVLLDTLSPTLILVSAGARPSVTTGSFLVVEVFKFFSLGEVEDDEELLLLVLLSSHISSPTLSLIRAGARPITTTGSLLAVEVVIFFSLEVVKFFSLVDVEDDEELLLLLVLLSSDISSPTLSLVSTGARSSITIGTLLAVEVVKFFSLVDVEDDEELLLLLVLLSSDITSPTLSLVSAGATPSITTGSLLVVEVVKFFSLFNVEDDEELLLRLLLLPSDISFPTLSLVSAGARPSITIGSLLAVEVVKFFSLVDVEGDEELLLLLVLLSSDISFPTLSLVSPVATPSITIGTLLAVEVVKFFSLVDVEDDEELLLRLLLLPSDISFPTLSLVSAGARPSLTTGSLLAVEAVKFFSLFDVEDDEELLLLLVLLSSDVSPPTLSLVNTGARPSITTGSLLAVDVVKFFSLFDVEDDEELLLLVLLSSDVSSANLSLVRAGARPSLTIRSLLAVLVLVLSDISSSLSIGEERPSGPS